MSRTFRKAISSDAAEIWQILADAIQRRKEDGSQQWQDGYPNLAVVNKDIEKGYGFVLTEGSKILAYIALMLNDEPAYADIDGQWQTDGDFIVYHRVAVAQDELGKGLAKQLLQEVETYAQQEKINSIRADTNFDNLGMLSLFQKLGYKYCGEVSLRGSLRKAYEKVI